jgi:hypothetical protein
MGGEDAAYTTEVNDGQHFMYYNKARGSKIAGYVPPTREGKLAIGVWLARARDSLAAVRGEERRALGLPPPGEGEGGEEGAVGAALRAAVGAAAGSLGSPMPPIARAPYEMHYLRASTSPNNGAVNPWIPKALPFLRADGAGGVYGVAGGAPAHTRAAAALEWPFFLADATAQRGIHCRFGMGGIIAEAHSDAGRNFITMQRGHKRYVLAPPWECGNLAILRDGPSARHSELDWSASEGVGALARAGALALEVVISAGDALYVPSGWFHFIVSLDTNVQCNTRSGSPPLHGEALAACGILPPVTEKMGDFMDADAPAMQPSRAAHGEAWAQWWPRAALPWVHEAYGAGVPGGLKAPAVGSRAAGAAAAPPPPPPPPFIGVPVEAVFAALAAGEGEAARPAAEEGVVGGAAPLFNAAPPQLLVRPPSQQPQQLPPPQLQQLQQLPQAPPAPWVAGSAADVEFWRGAKPPAVAPAARPSPQWFHWLFLAALTLLGAGAVFLRLCGDEEGGLPGGVGAAAPHPSLHRRAYNRVAAAAANAFSAPAEQLGAWRRRMVARGANIPTRAASVSRE